MSMTDTEYLREQRESRKHEAELVKIEADKAVRMEAEKQDGRNERMPYWVSIAGFIAFLVLVFIVGYLINQNDIKDKEASVACVATPSAQWIDGHCAKDQATADKLIGLMTDYSD